MGKRVQAIGPAASRLEEKELITPPDPKGVDRWLIKAAQFETQGKVILAASAFAKAMHCEGHVGYRRDDLNW